MQHSYPDPPENLFSFHFLTSQLWCKARNKRCITFSSANQQFQWINFAELVISGWKWIFDFIYLRTTSWMLHSIWNTHSYLVNLTEKLKHSCLSRASHPHFVCLDQYIGFNCPLVVYLISFRVVYWISMTISSEIQKSILPMPNLPKDSLVSFADVL